MKKLIILMLTLLTVLTTVACSSASKGDELMPEEYYEGSNLSSYDTGGSNATLQKNEYEYATNDTKQVARKVIRNAVLELRSDDAGALYTKVVNFGNSLGGYEYGYSRKNYNDYTTISLTFKVPPEELSAFVIFIEENAEVLNSTIDSDDITDSYYDTETRLTSKRNSLSQYYELLKKAKTIEEIVYIQKIIDGITEEIEALEGRLKLWNSQSEMATVYLNITQTYVEVKERKEIKWNTLSFEDVIYLTKLGFVNVGSLLVSLIFLLLIALGSSSLIWVPGLLIAWRMGAFKKRPKKAIKRNENDEKPEKKAKEILKK